MSLRTVFLAFDGKLRMFWRAVLYYCVGTFAIFPLLGWPLGSVATALHFGDGLSFQNVALAEIRNLTVAVLCTAAFAFYERRRIDSYGLPLRGAFSRYTFEGAAAGIIMAAAVAGGMMALGGIHIVGLAVRGSALVSFAIGWLIANVLVGLAEEAWFRGYLQQALWRSIGFWPASIVIALIFAAEHYFFKSGENIWDVITLVSISLLLSYSLLRTGSLWFAVGFHFAFDYMQLFVIGTPNGDRVPVGRLLDVQFSGPAWLTGGVLGTEASFLMYPAIALLWVYVWFRYRHNRELPP